MRKAIVTTVFVVMLCANFVVHSTETSSIRTPDGEIINIGDVDARLALKLGQPLYAGPGRYVEYGSRDSSKTVYVENKTYLVGKVLYHIEMRDGVIRKIRWERQ